MMGDINRLANFADTAAAATVYEYTHSIYSSNAWYQDENFPNHATFQTQPNPSPSQGFLVSIFLLIKKITYISFLVLGYFLISTCLYAILYLVIMPSKHAVEKVYFDYNHLSCSQERQELGTCSPTAIVDLTAIHTQWNAYTPEVVPSSTLFASTVNEDCGISTRTDGSVDSTSNTCPTTRRRLVSQKSYFINLALKLPESATNKNLGMFTVEMYLFDANLGLLASSSRPAVLPYQSAYVLNVRKSVLMGPLVLGAVHEARTIVVECFDHYMDSLERPLSLVEIKLVSPRTKEPVQVIDAELQIGNEPNFVQKVMKEWFYTSALASVMIIMFWLFTFSRTVRYLFARNRMHGQMRKEQRSSEGLYMDPDMEEFSYGGNVPSNSFDGDREGETYDDDHDSLCWEEVKHSSDEKGENVSKDKTTGDTSQREKMEEEIHAKKQQKEDRIKAENLMKEKVMTGDLAPYEIFTDLDQPD